jgi:hypothetical protein
MLLSAHSCSKAGLAPGAAGRGVYLESRMQFLELDCDPWREQRFVEKEHPTARMPLDDTDAATLYPAHRWVYDKRRLAASQGIECGTHELTPARYPVFCKPITTLKGMGAGSCVLTSERDQRDNCRAGDFWMRLLTGEHVSTDMAVVDGTVMWCRNTLGVQSGSGTFDYWVIEEGSRPRLERICREWIRVQLPGHTGMVNIETIGGSLISVHLRCADQWPDLYGCKWLDALMGLYNRGTWELPDNERAAGYSVVLFGPHGVRYAYPDPRVMADLRATVGISSIQLTFFEDRPPAAHAMPPGGFRLAVINSFNLGAALGIRTALAAEFGVRDPGSARRAIA